jgi:hypothetical protein
VLSLTLAGCFEATSHPPGMGEVLMSKEHLATKDDAICRGYGAQPGSDVYIQCRVSQDRRRDAVRNAPSDPIVSPAPAAASMAPMPNILPQTTKMPVGAGWHGNVADGLPIRALSP